ncbi:MAG: hypothetical protein Q7R30_14620 [Acidobacteriota bacterium]|nr:hypothetical protein [Acidobacteriota bacterium]
MPARLRPVALCAIYGVLSVVFCLPLFDQPNALGTNDWDQHLFYYGSVLKSVVEYGQLPFWNPWYCGGNVLWQNPQIALLSPVYPLTALMSLQLAMKVNIVLHYWIGFVGMHLLLTRVIGLTFLPAVIYLATLVTASGAPAIHVRVGHSVFLPGFYLPLQLYFFFRAFRTGAWRDIFLAAGTLALMVANGGTHILPMSFAALGTFSIVAAIAKRDWRPLMIVAAFTVAGLAYSAPKLLPVGLFVSGERFWDTRNPTEHPDRVTLDILRQTYLVPTQVVGGRLPQQRHGWHEYGNYIGPAGVLAVGVGLIWALLRRRTADRWFGLSLALTTVVLFTLSLGEFSRFAPASLATHLPLFSSFRIPSRYTIPFIQFAALTLAWASAAWLGGLRFSGWARAVVTIACLGASAHLIVMNRANFTRVFGEPAFDTSFPLMAGPSRITTDSESSAYAPGSPMLRALTEDRAFFHCYESLQTFRTAGADQSQVFAEGPANVNQRFSPNRIAFTFAGGEKPTRIYLNYNWSPGWTSTAGPVDATSREVMAFVVMQPGQSGDYVFSFVPPGLYAGLAIFVAAIALSTVLWRRRTFGESRKSRN